MAGEPTAAADAVGLQPARHARRATDRTKWTAGAAGAFVVATGHGSESVAVEMMKRGAYDYLVKGATFMQTAAGGGRAGLERLRAGPASDRGRGATARGPRGIGAARRSGARPNWPRPNHRLRVEMEERAAPRSRCSSTGRVGPRGPAEHGRRNGGRTGPRVEPAAQRHFQLRPGLQAAVAIRRRPAMRRNCGARWTRWASRPTGRPKSSAGCAVLTKAKPCRRRWTSTP